MIPHRKVVVGAIAGAMVTIGVWLLEVLAHIEQPPEIAAAEVVVVSAILAYLVPEKDQEGT